MDIWSRGGSPRQADALRVGIQGHLVPNGDEDSSIGTAGSARGYAAPETIEREPPIQGKHSSHPATYVAGGETGRRYRIRNGFQMNVEQLDNKNRPVRVLCFMPEGDLVVGDMMLAQKLALELFESDTLKVANEFSPPPFSIGPMP